MKKWLIVALIALALTGCSWKNFIKWFDKLEWERDDKTIRIVDIVVK